MFMIGFAGHHQIEGQVSTGELRRQQKLPAHDHARPGIPARQLDPAPRLHLPFIRHMMSSFEWRLSLTD